MCVYVYKRVYTWIHVSSYYQMHYHVCCHSAHTMYVCAYYVCVLMTQPSVRARVVVVRTSGVLALMRLLTIADVC